MKWSKYNILFIVQTEEIYLFFNTMSNSVLKLDSDNAKILMDYVTNAYLLCSLLPIRNGSVSLLQKFGIA